MPVTQQQAIFTTEEAERFAALWAGFDIGNASEAEAMGKGRAVRRLMAGKGVRLVDAFELPEIRAALDDQMQPARQPLADVAAMEAELEDLRGKVCEALENNLILSDALTREQELTARLEGRPRQNGSFTGPLLSVVLAVGLAVECVVAVMGLFGGRATPRPEPVAAAMVAAATSEIKPAEEIPAKAGKPATETEVRPDARPKAKPEPLPVRPESEF